MFGLWLRENERREREERSWTAALFITAAPTDAKLMLAAQQANRPQVASSFGQFRLKLTRVGLAANQRLCSAKQLFLRRCSVIGPASILTQRCLSVAHLASIGGVGAKNRRCVCVKRLARRRWSLTRNSHDAAGGRAALESPLWSLVRF